jgi:ABC-type bacteriocin/lantibiotic exporter with double-glycine peptidase domain
MPSHTVAHVPQSQTMSCWAASSAMLLGWRDSVCYTDETILEQFPQFGTDGQDEGECRVMVKDLGMFEHPEVCRTAEAWIQVLERGPVMVAIPGHWIVVAGIEGDETNGYQMYVLDPGASEGWWTYEQVEQAYELDTLSCDMLQL